VVEGGKKMIRGEDGGLVPFEEAGEGEEAEGEGEDGGEQ
jgi:hypothetical protein